jgi:hypothetical protein
VTMISPVAMTVQLQTVVPLPFALALAGPAPQKRLSGFTIASPCRRPVGDPSLIKRGHLRVDLDRGTDEPHPQTGPGSFT